MRWPADARSWIALGCFVLVLIVLALIKWDKSLLESDAFLILATAIVITGWVNGPVGWAYQATKGGGELAESNARIAEEAATSAVAERKSNNGKTDTMEVAAETVNVNEGDKT